MAQREIANAPLWIAGLLATAIVLGGCSGSATPPENPSDDGADAPPAADGDSDDGTDVVPPTDDGSDAEPQTDGDDATPDTPPPVSPPDPVPPTTSGASIAELIGQLQNAGTRDAAREALIAKGPAAVAELIKALDADDAFVRAAAAFALAQIGDKSALPELKSRGETEKADVAQAAILNAVDALEDESK